LTFAKPPWLGVALPCAPKRELRFVENRANLRRCRLLRLRLRLRGLRGRHRLWPALDRGEPASGKGINAGAWSMRPSHDGNTLAARMVGQVDAVGRADPAHHIAFGVPERHVSAGGCRRRARWSLG